MVFLKSIATLILFILWCAGLWFVWWVFGPETFWQRLVCVMIECVVALFWGVFCVFGGVMVWTEGK